VPTERINAPVALSVTGNRTAGDNPTGLKGAAAALALSARAEALLAKSRRENRRNDNARM
jgi:hypothetical protein